MEKVIYQKWRELMDKEPHLPSMERAVRIAKQVHLDPLSVASIASQAPNSGILTDDLEAYHDIYLAKIFKMLDAGLDPVTDTLVEKPP